MRFGMFHLPEKLPKDLELAVDISIFFGKILFGNTFQENSVFSGTLLLEDQIKLVFHLHSIRNFRILGVNDKQPLTTI